MQLLITIPDSAAGTVALDQLIKWALSVEQGKAGPLSDPAPIKDGATIQASVQRLPDPAPVYPVEAEDADDDLNSVTDAAYLTENQPDADTDTDTTTSRRTRRTKEQIAADNAIKAAKPKGKPGRKPKVQIAAEAAHMNELLKAEVAKQSAPAAMLVPGTPEPKATAEPTGPDLSRFGNGPTANPFVSNGATPPGMEQPQAAAMPAAPQPQAQTSNGVSLEDLTNVYTHVQTTTQKGMGVLLKTTWADGSPKSAWFNVSAVPPEFYSRLAGELSSVLSAP
jgi:hypothetical protein